MENKWIKQGNNYRPVSSAVSIEENLPTAIYSIVCDNGGNLSLNYLADKFEFDFEILDLESKFINHVLKSYDNTSGNFGIILNGTKGSGKTVSAKLLANSLNRPIILVDTAYNGIDSFIANLNFECVLFFDEFEKNFNPKLDINILTIMDGVYNCLKRKVFILTTNELTINPCLLSRPSRIRYKKEFNNISLEVINYLLDTFLKDQSFKGELFNYVTSLEVCSVDIIKSIITEVNIHGKESFEFIKEIFNVKPSTSRYHVVSVPAEYYDYSENLYKSRSRERAFKDLRRFYDLYNKTNKSDEETAEFAKMRDDDCCYRASAAFPCKFYELKVGMILDGEPIIEVLEDARIVVTRDTHSRLTYHYVCPTYVYNDYQGNILI